MADIHTGDGDGGNAQTTAEAGNQAPAPKEAGTDGSSGADDQEGEDDSGDDGEEDDSEPDDDGSEPSTRRDPSYYIGLRQGKKAARARQQRQEDDDDGGDEDDDDDGSGDGDIMEAVNKAIKPIADKLMGQEDESELSSFMAQNPAFKPYEKKIRRFMQHESRSHLPVSTIAMEAVGTDGMLKIGAKLARSADTKKATSKGGPTGGRAPQSKTNVWEMPKEDFQKMQDQVRYGKR